jgi:large subunit ribosomal protein L2
MGKNLIQQRRGKGSPRYRAPDFRYKGRASHAEPTKEKVRGEIVDLVNCSGHSGPLMQVKYEDGRETLVQAPEGVKVGDNIEMGDNVEVRIGNILPLKSIPEGTSIYNIESSPGDGGRFVRAAGAFAKIISKFKNKIVVQLPSNKKREFRADCRAVVGVIAGSGRKERPFLKAGKRYYAMRAKNKLWPKVSGTSMNAVAHPFGGSSSAVKGRPTQASRNVPAGRKVGKIAPKRTGRRKK